MNYEIGYIHHVGHVVRDMQQAQELYRRLGFLCPAPAYPVLSRYVILAQHGDGLRTTGCS